MKRAILCALPALALALIACGKEEREAGQWPLSKDELQRGQTAEAPGEASYRRYCVPCHGTDGRGNGGITGVNFVAERERLAAKSDAELESAVREGKRGERAVMPAHKPVLSDAQIHDVVLYVRQRYLKEPAAPP